MKLGEMHDVHAARLEGLHKSRRFEATRNAVGLLLLLCVEKSPRVFDVVVAGEGEVARQFLETVAVGVAGDRIERLPRTAASQQVEDAEPLICAGWRIEPRHEPLVARLRLANSEPAAGRALTVVASVPDELKIVGLVLRIEELVRRRKHRQRARAAARDNRAACDCNWRGTGLLRIFHAPELTVRVIPRHRLPGWR